MAEGYNHELLKSEAEMLDEIEQAIGETLTYRHGLYRSAEQTARGADAAIGS